jgi:hypothetical protein
MSGAQVPRVTIAPGATTLRLDLLLENPQVERATAVLLKDGAEIWRTNGLAPHRVEDGATLAVDLPAGRLAAGTYTLTLTEDPSSRAIAHYFFDVR